MEPSNQYSAILQQIINGNFEEALSGLSLLAHGTNQANSVVVLAARCKEYLNGIAKGTISQEAAKLEHNQLIDSLYALLRQLTPADVVLEPIFTSSQSPSPTFLSRTQRPPLEAAMVLGRTEDLVAIDKAFQSQGALLLLNGMGGVGKSTLAGYYMECRKQAYKHIAWVHYTSNLVNSCLQDINDYRTLGMPDAEQTAMDTMPPDAKFERLLHYMGHLPGPNLLIVDNLTKVEDTEDVATRHRQFPQNWKLLLTAREHNKSIPYHSVGVLNLEDARSLFLRHCPQSPTDFGQLDGLLEQVGRHTLVVEFLAKTTAAQGWSLEKMLGKLKSQGLTHLDTKVAVPTEHNEKRVANMVAYISALFDINLSTLTEPERWLLANLSVLPNFAHAYSVLEEMLFYEGEELESKRSFEKDDLYPLLNNLTAKGYLEKLRTRRPTHPKLENPAPEEDGFYMHPVMGEVIRDKEQPDVGVCGEVVGYFVDKFHNYGNLKNPSLIFPWLSYAETLANCMPEHSAIMMLIMDMSWVLWQKNELKSAKSWLLKVLNFQEKIIKENQLILSGIYNNLSLIYKYEGDHDAALALLLKSIEIKRNNLKGPHRDLATAYNNLSLLYEAKGDFNNALEMQKEAIQIREKVLNENHPDLAQSYHNIAGIYKSLGALGKAIRAEKKAILIRKKALGANHPHYALSISTLAALLDAINQPILALSLIKQAVTIYEHNYQTGHPNLDTALKWLAHIQARAAAAGGEEE